MSQKAYALIFIQPMLPELITLLEGYLHFHPEKNFAYILGKEFDQAGSFVSFQAIRNRDSKPWSVMIPVGCIAAIADMSQESPGIGFLSGSQQ